MSELTPGHQPLIFPQARAGGQSCRGRSWLIPDALPLSSALILHSRPSKSGETVRARSLARSVPHDAALSPLISSAAATPLLQPRKRCSLAVVSSTLGRVLSLFVPSPASPFKYIIIVIVILDGGLCRLGGSLSSWIKQFSCLSFQSSWNYRSA